MMPPMKNMIRSAVASFLLVAACMAFGAVPAMNVTVSDASGKAAFKGTTNANGVFATAKLTPGNYTVQLASQSAEVKGKHYAIVVAAGKKKVSAGAVPGEKFARGGVALKVDVGAGLNITGQVSSEEKVYEGRKEDGLDTAAAWQQSCQAVGWRKIPPKPRRPKPRGSMSKEGVQRSAGAARATQGNLGRATSAFSLARRGHLQAGIASFG